MKESYRLASRRFVQFCLIIGVFITCNGCASMSNADDVQPPMEKPFSGDPTIRKSIFVFHDGTRNDPSSGTNVRKMFEAILASNDAQITAIYIEGVGSTSTPLVGSGLGYGMEERILRGYDFIAQAYRPGDALFIFGFSRGAHSARALAGLLAYAGVPPKSTLGDKNRLRQHNHILEIVKLKNDSDYMETWKSWHPGEEPLVSKEIHDKLGLMMTAVEITFLGVWDTVPGSQFKRFGICKERSDRREGDRYKSDSYPPIHHIFHAVAMDEKRSKFRPLLICPAINPAYTKVVETWFPGAHADVGGGYPDSPALSNLSLQWMVEAMQTHDGPHLLNTHFAIDPRGLAHWSIGDSPGNIGSSCEDRVLPQGAVIDPSFEIRKENGVAALRINGVIDSRPYPLFCPGK